MGVVMSFWLVYMNNISDCLYTGILINMLLCCYDARQIVSQSQTSLLCTTITSGLFAVWQHPLPASLYWQSWGFASILVAPDFAFLQ